MITTHIDQPIPKPLSNWGFWLILIVAGLASLLCHGAEPRSVTWGRPEIEVRSEPLGLIGHVDCEYRMLARFSCVVTADTVDQGDEDRRDWYLPAGLKPYCVADPEYVGSVLQRGHGPARRWFAHHPAGGDVNCTCWIVPQTAEANNGPIRTLEQHVVDLLGPNDRVQVEWTALFEDVVRDELPRAKAPLRIPSGFRYELLPSYRLQPAPREIYVIPNRHDVHPDYRVYAVKEKRST